jgi:hypothetical protein
LLSLPVRANGTAPPVMLTQPGKGPDSMIWRWVMRGLLALAGLFVAVYAGDSVVFLLRSSPVGKVTVNRYLTIPLKGSKQEFDYQGTVDAPCSISLFPQKGLDPCWQVRRNANQGIRM